MPNKKQDKSRWGEPIVLVPIIVAIITAIIGPTYAYYYLQSQNPTIDDPEPQNADGKIPGINPTQEEVVITPTLEEPNPVSKGEIILATDKTSYGVKDYVRVSGTIDNPVVGKNIRLDVYDPEGSIYQPFNETFGDYNDVEKFTPAYPRLTDIQLKTNEEGEFFYRFPLDNPVFGPFIKGNYQIIATSGNVTGNITFTSK